jgi:hypothetical protein
LSEFSFVIASEAKQSRPTRNPDCFAAPAFRNNGAEIRFDRCQSLWLIRHAGQITCSICFGELCVEQQERSKKSASNG